MYSIKTQLTVEKKPYLAGSGIGVENNEGIITSRVLIAASRFAIVDPNAAEIYYPFVVQNDVAYIDTAFIKNGSIDMLKIGSNLQSSNYVPDVSSWAFRPDGTF
ncbi:DUF1983 domain-containing protein [Pseudomonas protegens]|uniref:phage tail tip fiber protein n=1 Tax=Pseudomonas protegens TaxID=380021 RepID=UPI00293742BD|nr:DUF1983 domain-containing protein [Pseudomonas protegens]WOE77422.1 DUF1983 domain-containing protein [Pseudomonas protegens]